MKLLTTEHNKKLNLSRINTKFGKQQTILANNSKKANFDHLELRESNHKAYKKINGILLNNGDKIYQKMVFSDYMNLIK
jgi:hypothetical protein